MSKQEKIDQTRQLVSSRAEYACEVCGKVTRDGQMAHRIPQRKHLVARYGVGVIHHPDNLAWTCPTDICNNAVSLGEHRHEEDVLASLIRQTIYDNAIGTIEANPELHVDIIDRLAEIAGVTTSGRLHTGTTRVKMRDRLRPIGTWEPYMSQAVNGGQAGTEYWIYQVPRDMLDAAIKQGAEVLG